jgi:hypothetical protein
MPGGLLRWRELSDDWFRSWRMRLPDEHLHHFDPESFTPVIATDDGMRPKGARLIRPPTFPPCASLSKKPWPLRARAAWPYGRSDRA